MSDMYEKAYRIYSYLYRKYYGIEKHRFDSYRYDKAMFVFLHGCIEQDMSKQNAKINIDEALIRFYLLQFEFWTNWKPKHQIEFHWMLGPKAWKRWKEFGMRYSAHAMKICFVQLLKLWGITYEDIIDAMIEGEPQKETNIVSIAEKLKQSHKEELPQFFEPLNYTKSAFMALSELDDQFLRYSEDMMSSLMYGLDLETGGEPDGMRILKPNSYKEIFKDLEEKNFGLVLIELHEALEIVEIQEQLKYQEELEQDYYWGPDMRGRDIKGRVLPLRFEKFILESYRSFLVLWKMQQQAILHTS